VDFLLLGPLELRRRGATIDLGRGKRRALLVALLLRRNEVVPTGLLVEALWGDEPPTAAHASLLNHVSRLRGELGERTIDTRPPGYLIRTDPESVDADRFERLLGEAHGLRGAKRAARLRSALALWRGEALADVTLHGELAGEIEALEERRLHAVEQLFEQELELGRHAEVAAELENAVARYPLRERFLEQLMIALYASGRQTEALAAFDVARRRMRKDLGLDPGERLKRLQRAILVHEAPMSKRARQDVPLTVLQRVIEHAPGSYAERADFAYRLGIAFRSLGEVEYAREALLEARDIAVRADAVRVELRVELALATQDHSDGAVTPQEYRAWLEPAVAEFRKLGDEQGLALALLALGSVRCAQGEVAVGLELFHEAAEHALQAVGTSWPTGLILAAEGGTLHFGPTPVGIAIARCNEILETIPWGAPGPIGVYSSLGVLHAMAGDAGVGRQFAARAVAACEEYGMQTLLARTIGPWAAAVEELAGDLDAAKTILSRIYEAASATGNPTSLAFTAPSLARVAAALGRADDALAILDAARDRLPNPNPDEGAWALAQGSALLQRGDAEEALSFAKRAVELAEHTDWLPERAATLELLGEVLLAAGRSHDAASAAAEALKLHERKENIIGGTRARALLERVSAARPHASTPKSSGV